MLEAGAVAAAEGVQKEAGAKRPAEDVSALNAEEDSKRIKTEAALEASTAIPPAPAHAVPSQAPGMIGAVQALLDQCFSTGICRYVSSKKILSDHSIPGWDSNMPMPLSPAWLRFSKQLLNAQQNVCKWHVGPR